MLKIVPTSSDKIMLFLNTNIEKELNNLARFLEMVVNYKHKINFKGQIKILNFFKMLN